MQHDSFVGLSSLVRHVELRFIVFQVLYPQSLLVLFVREIELAATFARERLRILDFAHPRSRNGVERVVRTCFSRLGFSRFQGLYAMRRLPSAGRRADPHGLKAHDLAVFCCRILKSIRYQGLRIPL